LTVDKKQKLIEARNRKISVKRQCELIELNRSTYYYNKRPKDFFNFELMKEIDKIYTVIPSYGSPRITNALQSMGYAVNHKRIERLMRLMGIAAICPKPNTSLPEKGHKIYPYLLKNVEINRPNQVWSTDITYIPIKKGFAYLVAVMDWHSRCILSWEISTTMDRKFCIKALKKALKISKPEIFNSDQGSQFTSKEFTGCLEKHGVAISMDGKGRAFDNIFIERLWRSVKYEEVYLHNYKDVQEAKTRLDWYFDFYNNFRLHSSLKWRSPDSIYNNIPEKGIKVFLSRNP
jgi:putative transposase